MYPVYHNTGGFDMPRKITDDCLACGICMDECQDDAISEGDPIYVIDPEKCTDCGSCQDVCPNDAIIEA
jgi:ferredoxin